MLALLLAASEALAVCVDNDADNYNQYDPVGCPSANDRADCDDADATINPNAVEVG